MEKETFVIDLNVMKKHLKVDHNLDDDLIENVYYPAAIADIKGAITFDDQSAFFKDNATFNIAVLMVLGHFYENRKTTSIRNVHEIPLGILSLVQRLRGEFAKWNLKNSTNE